MENRDDFQSSASSLAMVALIVLGDIKFRKITEGDEGSITAQVKKLTSQTISPHSLINCFKKAEDKDGASISPSIFTSDILTKYCLHGGSGFMGQELPSNKGLHWLKFKQGETVRAISLRSAGRLIIRNIMNIPILCSRSSRDHFILVNADTISVLF